MERTSPQYRDAFGAFLFRHRWEIYTICTFASKSLVEKKPNNQCFRNRQEHKSRKRQKRKRMEMPEFVSRAYARRVVESFIRRLGHPYAYVVYEEGSAGERTHIHALIGGLPKESIATGHKLWKAGIVKKWEKYDPLRGGCWYVSTRAQYGEFEFFGTPKRLRRRVRQKLIKKRTRRREKSSSSSLRTVIEISQNS